MAIDPEDVRCGACGTIGACESLGTMGNLHWFRCRACGMDVSAAETEPVRKKKPLKLGSRMRSIPLREEDRENPSPRVKTKRHSLSMEPGWPV